METLLNMLKHIKWAKLSLVALLLAAIAATLFLGSCKDNDPQVPTGLDDNIVKVVFTAKANNKDFAMDTKYTLTAEGFNYKFELLKFYLSKLYLVKTDGSQVLLKDIEMIDFRSDKPNLSVAAKVDAGEYKEITFGIGVDSVSNVADPSTYPANHPLSLTNGTYWDMGSQYRFLLIEGRLDTMQTDSFNVPFVVHTGTNELYRTKTLSHFVKFTKGDTKVITIEVDVDKFLSGINFKQKHVSHTIGGGFDIAKNIADNFVSSLSIKQ
ncbi:MAG: MbnP family protein [Bacteroidota bacterium]